MKAPAKIRGFTLLELMIATVIALICLLAAFSSGMSIHKINKDQQDIIVTQTSQRFAKDILVEELRRAGAGFVQIASMAYNQTAIDESRPYIPISIHQIDGNEQFSEQCTAKNKRCSLLTILSGEVPRTLAIRSIASGTAEITLEGSQTNIDYWRGAVSGSTPVSAFLLINKQTGKQCMFEDFRGEGYDYTPGSTNGAITTSSSLRLELSLGTSHPCNLDDFDSASSVMMPLRAARFLTNGFWINGNANEAAAVVTVADDENSAAGWEFISSDEYPNTYEPRLRYLPDSYKTQVWQNLSTEAEFLQIKYTAFNNANPEANVRELIRQNSSIMAFNPILMNSVTAVESFQTFLEEEAVLPNATGSPEKDLMDMSAGTSAMPGWDSEKFNIPLLRRLSQIEVTLLMRKACKDADPTNCTSGSSDDDDHDADYLYQVRNIATRVNPQNLHILLLNYYLR